MARIKIKRSTTDQSTPSGLTFGELAYLPGGTGNTADRLFIGDNDTASVWIGAEIENSPQNWTNSTRLATQAATNSRISSLITSSAVTSFNGLTGSLQGVSAAVAGTGIAVSGATGAVTITNTGVQSFNGLTGSVQGVSAAVGGTGISVSGTTGSVTITNTGVQSFNGLTGQVTGASLGANTFTALNTFNGGISAAGGTFSALTRFTAGISAAGGVTFAGDISVNGLRVGRGAGGISDNTALGADALSNNTTGSANIAVGAYALYSNTTGGNNSAVGKDALISNTTGSANIAVGRRAMYTNTEGSENTVIGNHAMISNMSGNYNVVVGSDALAANEGGSSNVAIGRNAGTYTQDDAIINSENSIYIGANTTGLYSDESNTIVIGTAALGDGSDTTVIGNSSTTSTRVFGTLSTNGGISAAGGTFNGIITLNGQTFTNVVSSVNGLTANVSVLMAPIGITSGNYTVFTWPTGITSTGSKRPFYQSPYYTGRASASSVMAANRTYFILHNATRDVSLTTLRLSTVNTGITGDVYFSVWSINSSNGLPNQRLYVSGALQIPSGFGYATVTNSSGLVNVSAGLFYLAASFSSTPSIYSHNADRNIHIFGSGEYTSGYNNYLPVMQTSGFTAPSSITQSGATFGFIDYYPTAITIPILEWQGK